MGKTFRRGDDMGSEAWNKRVWHKKLRAWCRSHPEELPSIRELSNPWSMYKDGKCCFWWKEHYYCKHPKIRLSRKRWLQRRVEQCYLSASWA